MQYLQNWTTNNSYFRECHSEPGAFHHYKKHISPMMKGEYERMPVMYCFYSYQNSYKHNPDLFSTLTEGALEKLRNKECTFVLDGTHEGWAPEDQPVAIALYNSAIRNNIDPQMISFLSGNLREKANFRLYFNTLSTRSSPINVIEIMHWDTFQKQMMKDKTRDKTRGVDRERNLDIYYDGKYYLNLSRRNRFWRSYCSYRLHQADIAKYGLLSHDVVTENDYKGNTLYSKPMQQFLQSNTPLIVDTDDFETNWATDLGIGLHNKVLFNLTSETMQSDWGETSLFYSEKTFKPIVQKTPVIIWGQTGQNYNLQRLGYKLYTDWFDYEFDFEPDIVKRWNKLEKELIRVCENLNKMTRSKQIEWSMKNTEVLEYNYERAAYNDYTVSEFLRYVEISQASIKGSNAPDDQYYSKNVL
jgi:hypothetical protein